MVEDMNFFRNNSGDMPQMGLNCAVVIVDAKGWSWEEISRVDVGEAARAC